MKWHRKRPVIVDDAGHELTLTPDARLVWEFNSLCLRAQSGSLYRNWHALAPAGKEAAGEWRRMVGSVMVAEAKTLGLLPEDFTLPEGWEVIGE